VHKLELFAVCLIAFTGTIIPKQLKEHVFCVLHYCAFVNEMMTLLISYITRINNKLLTNPCGCADLCSRSQFFIHLHERIKTLLSTTGHI
jgi:hypothetical protein